jgi:hypothetical protein
MNKVMLLLAFYLCLGIILDYRQKHMDVEAKVLQLEAMLEKCITPNGGVWNLQGYYFLCEAVYLGVADYSVSFRD